MEWGAVLQALGKLLSALWPFSKQRLAERKAGESPESTKATFDKKFSDALGRLGATDPTAPAWKKAFVGAQALVVRPETFSMPAVRAWLSIEQVAEDLKSGVAARLARREPPPGCYERLVATYMERTGEDARFAEAAIRIALAFLHASMETGARDTGLAAIVQATTSASTREVIERIDGLERNAKLSSNEHALAQFTGEARNILDKILKRRASPGADTLGDLRRLCADFADGCRFAGVDSSVQREARLWLGRMEVASGNVTLGQEIFTELEREGITIPPYVLALADLERGQIDAAVRRVRDGSDANSRTALFHILRKARGVHAALSYAESLDLTNPDTFNTIGWNNLCVTLALEGRMEDAASHLARLPASMRADCTHLEYLHSVTLLLPLVPADRRKTLVESGFSAIAEHVLEGPQAERALAAALAATKSALVSAKEADDTVLEERCLMGVRALRLVDPRTRELERNAIRAEMSDPGKAVRLIAMARMFGIDFESEPLEKYLARAEGLGGLDDGQLRAKLYLFDHPSRAAELVELLDEYWDRLSSENSVEALVVMKTQALVQLGEFEEAKDFLDSNATSVPSSILDRLRLMMSASQGGDASVQAIHIFERTSAIEDLFNVTRVLAVGKQWRRLLPFAQELFKRAPSFDSAMLVLRCLQHVQAPARDVADFLESTVDVAEQRPEIVSARAWARLAIGDHEGATKLKDSLLEKSSDPSHLSLEIALAVQTGDWESLPNIAARAWEQRHVLEPETLLALARLAGVTNKDQALQLAKEAVDRAGDSPEVLVAAHSIAIAAGRDDVGMPWVARAAELSSSGGPVQRFSQKELIEFMKSNAEGWRKKNDLYREGQVPVHMAASMFNAPLIQLLIGTSRRNANEGDARKRQPVPFRSGKRHPVNSSNFSRIALDITSLYLLCDLGLLQAAVNSIEAVFVSPRLMEALLNERERVAFHQPSRVAEVKPLHSLLTGARLTVVSGSPSSKLGEAIGEEAARLLEAAKSAGGAFVHPGILFKVSSFMEEVAELGDLTSFVVDPIDIAGALRDEGFVSQVVHCDAVERLVNSGCTARSPVQRGVPVFLDGLAVQYLNQSRLLIPLLNSGRRVHVHESTVNEWRALLETEPTRDELAGVIDEIRSTLRQGIVAGKVRLLPQSRRDRKKFAGTTLEPFLDLLDDASQVEAVVVDDRMAGGNSFLSDRANRNIPILSSLDIIDRLLGQGVLTQKRVNEILHRLRAGTMFCVPLSVNELNAHLRAVPVDQGKVMESAELRRLREYLQRLYSSEVLCTPADIEYMDELWRVGMKVISDLWATDSCPVEDAAAKATWIVMFVIPPIEITMRFAEGRSARIDEVASGRLLASFICAATSRERRRKYYEWLERYVLADLLPANGSVIDAAADQTAKSLAARAREIGNELSRRSSDSLP